tara:strand:- start:588 stop:1130 length:543 start_codon:yes stop_codon:yes gene_type:complete
MNGWLYVVKNRELYKIGITKNFRKRMQQLKPDNVVGKVYSKDFKQLEKDLHKKYKTVRLPQTEYFRLDNAQIRDIKKLIYKLNYPKNIIIELLVKILFLHLFLCSSLVILKSLYINDFKIVLISSLLWMKNISFCLSILSLFISSKRYFGFVNEVRYRISKLIVFLIYVFFFKLIINILS